jgi:hypothetical protein
VAENLHGMLTIGDLAAKAGLRPATLREWERRHGFPVPQRLPSGHRRYPVAAVEQVKAVLERQRAGLSLPAAIRAAGAIAAPESSIYAAVTGAGGRPPARRSRRAMRAFSRAIEDACLAAGGSTVIVGSFQRERVFRECEARWRELARSATVCIALADFAEVGGDGPIIEVPVAPSSPLHREWAVAAYGPRIAACLSGWEWPDRRQEGFEAVWSVEPAVVAAAIERGLDLARAAAPDRVVDITVPAVTGDPLGHAMSLMDRVVTRLDR